MPRPAANCTLDQASHEAGIPKSYGLFRVEGFTGWFLFKGPRRCVGGGLAFIAPKAINAYIIRAQALSSLPAVTCGRRTLQAKPNTALEPYKP